MKGLIYRNAEVKKFILRPTDQMEDLFNKTKVFTDSTIPWFKNLIPVLKTLMDKMVAEKASWKSLELEIEDYYKNVCVRDGSKTFFNLKHNNETDKTDIMEMHSIMMSRQS